MNVKNAVSAASYAASSGMLIKCPYCGSKTISLSDHCVCTWCEALIHKRMSETSNDSLSQAVSAIRQNYSSKNYGEAASSCDSAYAASKSAWFLYIKGIVLLSASNNETSLISYDKPGFMDENAAHRAAASKLYADSRLSLYKAVSSAGKVSADSKAQEATVVIPGNPAKSDGEFDQESLKDIKGVIEPYASKLDIGEVVQLERFGFAVIDGKDPMRLIFMTK